MNFFHKIPVFFFGLFYPCKIIGKENIPKGNAVFAVNHFSALDCGYIAKAYSKDIKFLAKQELFNNKFIGGIIKSFGAIPINRENPDMKSLIAAIRVLKEGHKLAIFVEGTRNKTGTNALQSIKGGTVVFAVKAKCPIVPMMIYRKAKPFRKNYLIIGKPFTLDEFYDKKHTEDDIEKMGDIVREKMIEQQNLLFDMLKTKK